MKLPGAKEASWLRAWVASRGAHVKGGFRGDSEARARGDENELSAGLEAAVNRWFAFVREVERGYEDSIYDYTEELSRRDLLDAEMADSSPRQSEYVRRQLSEADSRFLAATRPSIRPVLPGVSDRQKERWYRVPKKLSEELASDLRADGVIR